MCFHKLKAEFKPWPRLFKGTVDPCLINPLPLIGIIKGILLLRPLKGRGLLIMGLHYVRGLGMHRFCSGQFFSQCAFDAYLRYMLYIPSPSQNAAKDLLYWGSCKTNQTKSILNLRPQYWWRFRFDNRFAGLRFRGLGFCTLGVAG